MCKMGLLHMRVHFCNFEGSQLGTKARYNPEIDIPKCKTIALPPSKLWVVKVV